MDEYELVYRALERSSRFGIGCELRSDDARAILKKFETLTIRITELEGQLERLQAWNKDKEDVFYEMQERIAELEEERRWRNYPEEKIGDDYIDKRIEVISDNDVLTVIYDFHCPLSSRDRVDTFELYRSGAGGIVYISRNDIQAWRPLPAPPCEEEKT